MSRKALRIVADLEIQAVTCPGVWLCPNGHVQLLFSMLGQEVQTKRLPPVFPLLFHEKLTFQKTFTSAGCLAEVQNALSQEDVFAVLLQETEDYGCSAAIQLARFHTSALHILYPSPCSKGLLAGVDVDLLMEPSADYPGILSPKIELSTKTVIEEVTNIQPEGYVINPKTLSSKKKHPSRDQTACDVRTIHSDGGNKRRTNVGKVARHFDHPIGTFSTTNPRLSLTPPFPPHDQFCGHMRCCGRSSFLHGGSDAGESCQCKTGHKSSTCPLCTRYKAIFSSQSDFPDSLEEERNQNFESCHYKKVAARNTHEETTKRLSNALHAHVDHVLQSDINNIMGTPERGRWNAGKHFIRPTNQHRKIFNLQSETGTNTSKSSDSQTEPQLGSHGNNQKPYYALSQTNCGDGANFNSSRQLFYANLEKFYRKLYARAKSRVQEESQLGGSTT